MLVEQAIFGSARTGDRAGYHLVSRSPGLAQSDARELAEWGPSHDSLVDSGPRGQSYNFFPLRSGAFCISKTSAAGAEFSGRGGAEVRTQCLVVSAEVFFRFSNNPFAVLRAAEATGRLRAGDSTETGPGGRPPEALRLVGRSAVADHLLLAELARAPGAKAMAVLVEQALAGRSLVVVSRSGEKLMAGLISCLPLPLRSAISFSTGLKLSPWRPFRISAAPADSAALRREARALGADVLVLEWAGEIQFSKDSWPARVEIALRESKFSQLANEILRLAASAPDVVPAEVPTIGEATPPDPPEQAWALSPAAADDGQASRQAAGSAGHHRGRSDQAHARFERNESAGTGKCYAAERAQTGLGENREALELIERLDDLVFDAIAGKPTALARLVEFWPEVLTRLDPAVLTEAREQYLRHALVIWTQSDSQGVQDPQRVVAALDVLCLLFPEADFA